MSGPLEYLATKLRGSIDKNPSAAAATDQMVMALRSAATGRGVDLADPVQRRAVLFALDAAGGVACCPRSAFAIAGLRIAVEDA